MESTINFSRLKYIKVLSNSHRLIEQITFLCVLNLGLKLMSSMQSCMNSLLDLTKTMLFPFNSFASFFSLEMNTPGKRESRNIQLSMQACCCFSNCSM